MNLHFKTFGEEWEFEDEYGLGNHFSEFAKGLRDIIVYTDEKLDPEDKRKLDLLLEKADRYKIWQIEKALKS